MLQDTIEGIIHNSYMRCMGKPPRKKSGPKPKLGTARSAAIAVRTTYGLKEAAERAAAAERRSLSAWVELLIIEALEGKKK
jgi:predicted HicB family RNase H-like nuclease